VVFAQRILSTPGTRDGLYWPTQAGEPLSFIIGGPDGLDAAVLARAQLRWSLSALTFPHALVRILLAEQLYRAATVLAGHPYHRAS